MVRHFITWLPALVSPILTVSGPVVRIAPNQYSIDDPSSAKIIYGHGTDFVKVGASLL